MKRKGALSIRLSAFLILISLLAACGANAEPVLPTLRPTFTTAPTITPSATRVFNATATPPPTLDPAVAIVATDGPSPTALIGATSARAPVYTLTPTRQSGVSGSLSIEYFTTTSQSVRPGDKLTLNWSVKGTERAIIYRLNPDGSHAQLWQVGRAGSLDVTTRAADQDVARFSLTISDNISRVDQALSVPLTCSQQTWFFAPAPSGCPADPSTQSAAAQQNFERGQMIWISTQGRIYVLFNDNKKPAWIAYADEFKDGMPERDNALSPPANLAQPIRGFGLIWRTKDTVRERLGWATGPELPFDGAYQSDNVALPNTTLYLRARDKAILELSAKGDTWRLIVPTDKK